MTEHRQMTILKFEAEKVREQLHFECGARELRYEPVAPSPKKGKPKDRETLLHFPYTTHMIVDV